MTAISSGLDMIPLISLVLGSSVVSAFVTRFFIKLGADKKIRIENITQERKEWRDRIRELTVELTEAFDARDRAGIRKVEAELIVRLNPEDQEDLKIIQMLPELYSSWSEKLLRRVCDHLAYLLKHDWERAKKEVSGGLSAFGLLLATIFVTISAVGLIVTFDFFIKDNPFSLSRNILFIGCWFAFNIIVHSLIKTLPCCICKINTCCFAQIDKLAGRVRRLSYRIRCDRKTDV